MKLRVELKGTDGSQWLAQQVAVPRKAKGEGHLSLTGGAWTWNDDLYSAQTLDEVQQALAADVRNDQVETRLSFWSRRSDLSKRFASEPQELVVTGQRSASVVVRR